MRECDKGVCGGDAALKIGISTCSCGVNITSIEINRLEDKFQSWSARYIV